MSAQPWPQPKAVADPDPTPEPQTIHFLMGKVLDAIAPVGKNSQAPANMGGYAFRGIEDVLAAVKPAMGKYGVFCVPVVLERVLSERQVGQNKTMFVVDLHMEWTFYGPAGDSVVARCWGQGTDMGDKATQKAMTSAFKSVLMQTFAIGDSATDSERHSVPETEAPDPDAPFKALGWEDKAHHDRWRQSITSAAAKLDKESRKAFKASWPELGFVWSEPTSADVAVVVGEELAKWWKDPEEAPAEAGETPEEPRRCPDCGKPLVEGADCLCSPF